MSRRHSPSDSNALQNISDNAHRLIQLVGPSSLALRSPRDSPRIHTVLPSPQPITLLLVKQGVRRDAAEQLSQTFLQHALSLKRKYDSKLQETIATLARSRPAEMPSLHSTIEAIRSTYLHRYTLSIEAWRDKVVLMAEQHASSLIREEARGSTPSGPAEKRSTFKPVCLAKSFTACLLI